MTSVLVVGGGIAGYCAALAARREGADVTVVARAPGATALYAGGMEIVDDLDAVLKDPHHPFARLGMGPVGLATELDLAVSTLKLALAKEGLPLEGDWRSRGLYADIHGISRPANVVPASVAKGELGALRGKRVAVIGVREIGDYDAESTALALRELHGIDAFPDEITMPDLPVAASLTDLYGRRAPDPDGNASTIAYPPGLSHLPGIGFELLSSPPSPHGWRLQQAIGLGVVTATVTAVIFSEGRITGVTAGQRTYHADAYVLAMGRHIGGGLVTDWAWRGPKQLFSLGMFYEGRRTTEMAIQLRHRIYLDPTEEMRIGVMTDSRLHPLAGDGSVKSDNLYAAGAMLGGYDYSGPCGFGVPILTGWLAGRFAARQDASP